MRVVVIGPLATSVLRFRAAMLRTMVEAGHEVVALAPDENEAISSELASWGVRYDTFPMSRVGLNPLRDVMTTVALSRILRASHADVVLAFSSKPVVYGLLAARTAGVEVQSAMITGAGSALASGTSAKHRVVSYLLRWLYRMSLRRADVVFFQNDDDEQLFRTLGLVRDDHRIERINGSGVDVDAFAMTPLPPLPVTFLMISRLIRDKGLVEYVEAARRAKDVHPEARFQLLGPLDVNPTAISEDQLSEWQSEGVIEYLGSTDDVRPALTGAHVCVLPSYGEGMPRAVLEAMSMGRPILTTDVPGCRDTVEPGENGFIVPVRDPVALAERMIQMVDEAGSLDSMGQKSRIMAEERFDVREVNRIIMRALDLDQAPQKSQEEH